jgi:hypothetical protein
MAASFGSPGQFSGWRRGFGVVDSDKWENQNHAARSAGFHARFGDFDRGHGRPPQAHTGERGSGPVIVNLTEHLYPVEERKAL